MSVRFNEVSAETQYKIGVYYIVCNGQNPNQDWRNLVARGMQYAIPRLNNFFSDEGIYWSYESIAEVNIDYELKSSDINLPSRLYDTIPLIADNRPTFISEYDHYDIIILLFAGDFRGAYSCDYHDPIYASEDMFESEGPNKILIEHETLHTFGLPDHNWPHLRAYYSSCTMGCLTLENIQLCPECQEKMTIPNNQFNLNELGVNTVEPDEGDIFIDEPDSPEIGEPLKSIPLFRLEYLLILGLFLIIYWRQKLGFS